MTISKVFAAATLLCLGILGAAPAQAGEAELAVLTSYIGSWQGESVLVGSENNPDPFRCRLTVSKGTAAKINYAGRCTLITTTVSVSGTIAYFDESQRYEAAMSSNAGFSGIAIGYLRGDTIDFDLKERKKDRGGSDVRLGSRIILHGDTITVFFEVEFNDSGELLTAEVPFKRK